jgi:hypothetical protein
LRRSVAQLAAARPGLVHPANTAREIADMAQLPPMPVPPLPSSPRGSRPAAMLCALWLRLTGWPRVMPMPPLPGSA